MPAGQGSEDCGLRQWPALVPGDRPTAPKSERLGVRPGRLVQRCTRTLLQRCIGSSDGGHSGGPGDGHDSGHESAVAGLEGDTHDEHEGGSGGGDKALFCEHVVEMHQLAVVLPPTDPPIEEEGESPTPPEPSVSPPDTESPVGAVRPTVAAAASTPRTLPATGSTVSLMLVVGGLLVAAGAALTATTRVRGDATGWVPSRDC